MGTGRNDLAGVRCKPLRALTTRRGLQPAEPALETAVLSLPIAPKYLKNVLTSSPVPSNYQIWHTPSVQQCDRVVRKAYPALKITPPTNPLTGSDQTFYAVESACLNLALFTTIAKAAGKNLTWSGFAHAGYALRNAAIPGSGAPVSFGPGRAYAIGPVYLVTYDSAKNVLQFSELSGGEVTRVCRAALVRRDGHVQDQDGPAEAGSRSRPAWFAGQRVIELPEAVCVDQVRQLVA